MAAALAACKIVREMAHLQTGAEVRRTASEAKYEQLALGELRLAVSRHTRRGRGHLRGSSWGEGGP